jgi:hypothetical protein
MSEPSLPTRLIVLLAFDRDEEGELRPAFEPREMRDEDQAKRQARMIKEQHVGVIAWSRDAQPDVGEFGPPQILAQYGEVPEME